MSNQVEEQHPKAAGTAPRNSQHADVSRQARLKIKNNLVFVAEKLNILLEERRLLRMDNEDAEVEPIPELVKLCWLPILEAVREWGVKPEGVIIAANPWGSGHILLQSDFDCAFPGSYETIEKAQEALAQLIRGYRIPGGGTLVYRNQFMTPVQDLSMEQLPKWPDLLSQAPSAEADDVTLDSVRFREGFALLDRTLFDEARSHEVDWLEKMAGAKQYVAERTEQLAGLIEKVPEAGWACSFAWLHGFSTQEAMEFGRQADRYDTAIADLTSRIRQILSRLERDALTLGDLGDWIELHNLMRAAFESGSRSIH